MTQRGKKLRSAPPGPGHQPSRRPRRRTLCLITDRGEKLRSAPPIHVICHLEHVDIAVYALLVIEAKSNEAHHLDLVIGHLEYLECRPLCVESYRGEKQRSAPPGAHHRPPGTPRCRPPIVITYRGEKLRSSQSGPHHRPPGTPRHRTLCVMTYKGDQLRSTPPGPCHLWFIDTKNCGTHHPRLVTGQTNLHMNQSFYLFFESFLFRTEQSIKLILMFCSWTPYLSKDFAPFSERSVFKRFVQLCIPEKKVKKILTSNISEIYGPIM